jgi:hypothetical protein
MPGIRLSSIDLGPAPGTFELLCVRVTSGISSCIVAVVYRPGSAAISPAFFSDVSDVFDRLATYNEPVLFVGDVNIRLDRPTDASCCEFTALLSARGFTNRVTTSTHDKGGMLDVVVTRSDLPPLDIDVIDVGLSDHRLLQWSSTFARPAPTYTTVTCRP